MSLPSRIYIFILALILFLFITRSSCGAGLLFNSNDQLIANRTSLDLFDGKKIKFNNDFSIEFELSVWDDKKFGYILRLIDKNAREYSLVFVNFMDSRNFAHISFNCIGKASPLLIPINKNSLGKGKWINIKISFSTKFDNITLRINENEYTIDNAELANPGYYQFVYGLYGTNLDVPQIAVKNIEIKKTGKVKYFFPLNESGGSVAHDKIKGEKGKVSNPIWIINKHHRWNFKTYFPADIMAGITFDTLRQSIDIYNKDSVCSFNISTEKTSCQEYTNPIPFITKSGGAILNNKTRQTFVYTLGDITKDTPSITVKEQNSLKWEKSLLSTLDNRLHHHNIFFDNNDDLYVFGGYGNFSYSNKLYKYDKISQDFTLVKLTGDTITPRFFSAQGAGRDSNEILIFGGFGNESGHQEMGGRNLYDLYSINIKDKTIKKLWTTTSKNEHFVPCNNLILDKDKSHFYALCYPHHLPKTNLQLYKFSLNDGHYSIVSDTISITSEKIESAAFLFFNNLTQEFYIVIREYIRGMQSDIRIYSLSAPPVNYVELNQTKYNSHITLWIIICGIIGSIVVLLFLYGKGKKYSAEDRQPQKVENIQVARKVPITTNAIYLFGTFEAYDKNGYDITHRFSNRIKQMFSLVLLHTFDSKMGISTQELTSAMWPDKSAQEAKNNRGVTTNHLRSILKDMEGVELLYGDSLWSLQTSHPFYCDYLTALDILTNPNDDNINTLPEITSSGSLLYNMDWQWLENYKINFEEKLTKILLSRLPALYEKFQHAEVLKYVDSLNHIAPYNEDILRYRIKAMVKLGKVEQAQNYFQRFTSEFQKTFGEPYPLKYEQILKG
ncbi:MAG: hypothetical protein LBH34_02580 [Prevotellaceae bacterium]|jgi:DNA-binding SARP family transcriptional activator|nr:hypothetical protein [Prevotellaceae bacterium]